MNKHLDTIVDCPEPQIQETIQGKNIFKETYIDWVEDVMPLASFFKKDKKRSFPTYLQILLL